MLPQYALRFPGKGVRVHELELVLVLLAAVVVLATLANRIGTPYPIFLVAGGLVLALIPGLPEVHLEPDAVFLLFLPPILFSAAYFTDWRAFKANRRPIGLLAVGSVLATTCGVAIVAHTVVDGMTWPVAFVLGAIVSPPDAVATVAIVQRLGIPRRIVTILEGESLVNDATALVTYRFAVAAVVTGSFSLFEASRRFPLVAVGGAAYGLVFGIALIKILPKLLGDTPIGITATLLAPAAAYIPAEELGLSGVLATVAAGLVLGRKAPVIFPPEGRTQGVATWSTVIFVINGLVFILIGLQLPTVLDGLDDWSSSELAWYGLAVSATTIVLRFVWVFPATYLPRIIIPTINETDPKPPWQAPALIGFAGLRGVVTLAGALALPLEVDGGAPFPQRDLVLFLSFCVILATLVGQGLSLAPFVRWLGIADERLSEQEELLARRETTLAALSRLAELRTEPWVPSLTATLLNAELEHRLEHFPESLAMDDTDGDHLEAHDRLRRELLDVQHRTVLRLRNEGQISDEVLHRVQYDLDLAAQRSAD
jgi:Na+/H+ antiporter